MDKKTKKKVKDNLRGKTRELDKMEKVLKKKVIGEELTESQTLMWNRYITIVNFRTAGFTGRMLENTIKSNSFFNNLSIGSIQRLIYEAYKYFGKHADIDKQAERYFLAQELEEVAFQERKAGNIELWLKCKTEAAKLKGLYDTNLTPEPLSMPKVILSSDAKAQKALENNYEDVETVEG